MPLENLVNIQGTLASALRQIDTSTWQHSDEITKARAEKTPEGKIANPKLRDMWFWTADGSLYQLEDSDVRLYLMRKEENLILQNIDVTTTEMIRTENYLTTPFEVGIAHYGSLTTLCVSLSTLELTALDYEEFGYFLIDTANYADTLNRHQKKVAERAYGSMAKRKDARGQETSDFDEAMQMLRESGQSKARVYVLNPEYVKWQLRGDKDIGLVRACGLRRLQPESIFNAILRRVEDQQFFVRGAPLSVNTELYTKA